MRNLREFFYESMRIFRKFCSLLRMGWGRKLDLLFQFLSNHSLWIKYITFKLSSWDIDYCSSLRKIQDLQWWCSSLYKAEWKQINYTQPCGPSVCQRDIFLLFFYFPSMWTGPFQMYYTVVFEYYFRKRWTNWDRALTYCPSEFKSSEKSKFVLAFSFPFTLSEEILP